MTSLKKALVLFLLLAGGAYAADLPEPSASHLPRWRGFNLTEKMNKDLASAKVPFSEDDFRWISQLGFNFVRLPLDYRFWIKDGNWERIDEAGFADIDQAVAWGHKYHLHVCLSFHRAPGYTINEPKEPRDLWTDKKAQEVCAKHWAAFARRYKGIPSRNLSFNLFNEPPEIDPKVYAAVVKKMAEAIRAEDPDRLIIADGLKFGTAPVPELKGLKVAEATRGYEPRRLTHYGAHWVPHAYEWHTPQWPDYSYPSGNNGWLKKHTLAPWQKMQRKGIGVMVGEFGTYRFTPHKAALAWMKDCLGNWKKAGWGWALWNFRGAFGVLDSGRPDVVYEEFHGHLLDREMLELLQKN